MSTAAAAGDTEGDQCSWKLPSSTASASYGPFATSMRAVPMFPADVARSPAARSIDSNIKVVVVLPSVPVTTSHSGAPGRRNRQASSGSPHTGTPDFAAATSNGASRRQPGEVTTSCASSGKVSPSPTRASTPSAASSLAAATSDGPDRASTTTTFAPSPASARAQAAPETPMPATHTDSSCHDESCAAFSSQSTELREFVIAAR